MPRRPPRRARPRSGGHEEAQLPGDDLAEEAIGAQALAHRFGEAGELDPVLAHDADAAQLKSARELDNRPALGQRRESGVWREAGRLGVERRSDPLRRDLAADEPLPGIGLKAVDARGIVGKPVPDRQQEARDDVDFAGGELRDLSHLVRPGLGEGIAVGFAPMGLGHRAPAAWTAVPSAGSAARGVRLRRRRA